MQAEKGMRGRKVLASVTAATLAASMMTFAPLGNSKAYAAADTSGYVTCDAYRAAEPAPEILGISGISTNNAWTTVGSLDWSAPVYYIMGTDLNSNANPYMLNAVDNYRNGNSDAQPSLVYTQRQGGPMAAKYAYGENENCDAAWNMMPDIVLGTGQGTAVDYSDAAYAPAAGAANANPDYTTVGIAYDSTNLYTMIDTMYDLAEAADGIVADSNGAKKLRYGNATDIAKQYEKYVRGTQGYILSQLNGAQKKTVALVNNYDAATGTYTLVQTGVAEGTAAANRYLEACQNVAINLADTKAANEDGSVTATRDELAQVDLILLGSQAGSEVIASTEDILASFTAEMQENTYWVNSATGSAGSCYGVVMNSVENAQNIGRILGCLYPDYVDQDSWISYYYDNFYHLTASGLANAVDNAMDGVRNWDAVGADLTSWTTDDAADYNEASVDQKLEAGIAYIQNNASSVPALLQLTSDYTGETPAPSVSFPDVDPDQWYAEAVEFVNDEGLITGYDSGLFGVGDPMTRAAFATIMWRYADPAAAAAYDQASAANQTGMTDVANAQWYTGAANWAVANGVINGVENADGSRSFNPDGYITLDQMAVIVKNLVAPDASSDAAVLSRFTDGDQVESYAAPSVAWAVEVGLVSGSENADGTRSLLPTASINRERVATILYNAFEKGVM